MLEQGRWAAEVCLETLQQESGVMKVDGELVEYMSLNPARNASEAGAVYRYVRRSHLDEKLRAGVVKPDGTWVCLETEAVEINGRVQIADEVRVSLCKGRMGVGVTFGEGGLRQVNAVLESPMLSEQTGARDLVLVSEANSTVVSYLRAGNAENARPLFVKEGELSENEKLFIVACEYNPKHKREELRWYRALSDMRENRRAGLYQLGVRRLIENEDAIEVWTQRRGEKISWRVNCVLDWDDEEMWSLFEIDLSYLPASVARLLRRLGESEVKTLA